MESKWYLWLFDEIVWWHKFQEELLVLKKNFEADVLMDLLSQGGVSISDEAPCRVIDIAQSFNNFQLKDEVLLIFVSRSISCFLRVICSK